MRATGARISVVVGVVVGTLLAASPAFASHGRLGAAAGSHPVQARIDHRLYGLVPSALAGGQRSGRPTWREFARSALASTNNLSYHGGPVMQTNTTYAIYWEPSGYSGGLSGANPDFSSPYQTVIDQFLGDVAAAKNASTDTYAVDTQYYSGSSTSPSYIQNNSTFAGSAIDTDPLPANQCSSEYSGTGVTVSGCITDAQLQAEITHFLSTQEPGWTPGPNTEFFVLTPRNLGSCVDTSSGECSYTYYCAYHSNYTNPSGGKVLYANQPYTESNGVGAPGACASGQYPNGDAATDSTINVLSHEHNETITDPLGSSWYDSSGNEIGDKCAWNFGTALGSTSYGQYNQVINGHYYYLQQEWSNASSACALKYGIAPPQPSLTLHLGSTSFTAGQGTTGSVSVQSAPATNVTVSLSSTGSGAFSPTSVTIQAGSTTSSSFTYNDDKAQTNTITASASGYNSASQSETVVAGSASTVSIAPASASVGLGGSQTFTASAVDQYGNTTSASGTTWTTSYNGSTGTSTSLGSVSPGPSASTTFTASSTTTGSGSVNATLNGATASATVTVTAIANPIVNGGFESGDLTGWTKSGATASENVVLSSSYHCFAGSYCAMLGLTTPTNGTSNIAQTFTAPSGSSTVSFWYEVVCTDTVQYDWATATLRDVTTGLTTTILPRTCNLNHTWVKVSAAVTPGHKYTLTLTNRDDNYASDPTYTLFDNVSVQ